MAPTVYIIRPKSGWDWNDYIDNWYHDWTSRGKAAFEAKGYKAEIIDGCTINQFKTLLASNSTVGIVIAAHGTPFGIGIQVDKESDPEMGTSLEASHLRNHGNKLHFFAAVGCEISQNEINKMAESLQIHKSRVLTPPKKYQNKLGQMKGFVALEAVLQQAVKTLPHASQLQSTRDFSYLRLPPSYRLRLLYSRRSLVPRTVLKPVHHEDQTTAFPMMAQRQRQLETIRQRGIQDAGQRRQAEMRRQHLQQANQHQRMQRTIHQRIAAAAVQQRRSRVIAPPTKRVLGGFKKPGLGHKQAQADFQRRQLALQAARYKQAPRSPVRPEFWPRPKHVPLPRTHHLSMTVGPFTVRSPGHPPRVIPGSRFTHKWTGRW